MMYYQIPVYPHDLRLRRSIQVSDLSKREDGPETSLAEHWDGCYLDKWAYFTYAFGNNQKQDLNQQNYDDDKDFKMHHS